MWLKLRKDIHDKTSLSSDYFHQVCMGSLQKRELYGTDMILLSHFFEKSWQLWADDLEDLKSLNMADRLLIVSNHTDYEKDPSSGTNLIDWTRFRQHREGRTYRQRDVRINTGTATPSSLTEGGYNDDFRDACMCCPVSMICNSRRACHIESLLYWRTAAPVYVICVWSLHEIAWRSTYAHICSVPANIACTYGTQFINRFHSL